MKNLEGEFDQANQKLFNGRPTDSIKLFAQIAKDAETAENYLITARSLHGAGLASLSISGGADSSRMQQAITFLEQAAKYYKLSEQEDSYLAQLYNDIATAYRKSGLNSQAIEYIQKSIETAESLEQYIDKAKALANMALIYLSKKDFNSSNDYFQKCFQALRKDLSGGIKLVEIKYWFSQSQFVQKQYSEAKLTLEDILSWCDADHDGETFDEIKSRILCLLGIVEHELGNESMAKLYAAKYIKLTKSFEIEARQSIDHDLNIIVS